MAGIYLVENVTRESPGDELAFSTLSATLVEQNFFKKMSGTLHGSGPGEVPPRPVQTDRSQKATQGIRRRRPKLTKGTRRVLEIVGPERPTGKTEVQDMERTTSIAHGYTEGAAKHAT